MDDDDELILIGKIRPGETINLTTREIVIHKSWYASYTRWWNTEQRDNLPEWVEKVMLKEIESFSKMCRKDLINIQRNKILIAISGIRNLCLTYVGDPVATKLSLIIADAEMKLWKIDHPATPRINILNHHSIPQLEWPYPCTF